jgi:uncharacterized membrane protein SpoIIM required for sporulation
MPNDDPDLAPLKGLRRLLRSGPPSNWSDADLSLFPRLYRQACTLLARLEASGGSERELAQARRTVAAAHAVLHARRESACASVARLVRLLLVESPRAIRREWRLLLVSAALVYGLAALAWAAVARDLDLASSLLGRAGVEAEIEQLRELEPGESFRGNFDFGIGESPGTAGWIMTNNMRVGALFFASALLPPLYVYVLAANALMLGTYTGVAWHWGQAGAISSILWCHGVLEIQAILLAGTAGLCLVRAWLRPGARTRGHALAQGSRNALLLLAPTFPMLFAAGLIEGFVSPHAPLTVRLAVAGLSGLALVLFASSGRSRPEG